MRFIEKSLRGSLVVVSIAFCLAGFIYNTYGTFDKFILGAKLVITSSEDNNDPLPLPDFVLCNETAYKEYPTLGKSPIWQKVKYLELTRNPEEIFVDIKNFTSNYEFHNISHKRTDLYTAFQGRCSVIHTGKTVSFFIVGLNQDFLCAISRQPQTWISPVF